MKRDSILFFYDIIEAINNIQKSVKNLSKDKFSNNKDILDANIRRLEIIGEATKNLPSECREKYSEVPWKGMARMRDRISHHYFDIDYNIVWGYGNKYAATAQKTARRNFTKRNCREGVRIGLAV